MENTKKKEFLRVIKFTLFSISAGLIQVGSFAILNDLIKMPPVILVKLGNSTISLSYLISLVLSVIWNFTFNRKFTFKSANNVPIAMLKVFGYYLVFTPLSTWLEGYLEFTVGLNEYIVLAICMILNFVTEFIFQRLVVFRKTIDTNDIAKKEQEKEQNNSVENSENNQ